jgi:hypothetical protein
MRHINRDPSQHADQRRGRWAPALAIGVATAAASVAWSSVAGAAAASGCGTAWTFADKVTFVAAAIDANDVDRGEEFAVLLQNAFDIADRNQDGYVCYRFNKGNDGQDKTYVDPTWDLEGHYVITNVNDNNSRPR